MINLSFHINWPWFDNDFESKDYFYKFWSVTKNKTLEIQVSRGGNTIIGSSIRWDLRTSHAGLMIDLELFRRFIHLSFCDNRHWNDEEDRYVNYDNPEEVEKYL